MKNIKPGTKVIQAGGLAGIIGVVITLALAAGLFRFIARSSRAGPPPVSGGD